MQRKEPTPQPQYDSYEPMPTKQTAQPLPQYDSYEPMPAKQTEGTAQPLPQYDSYEPMPAQTSATSAAPKQPMPQFDPYEKYVPPMHTLNIAALQGNRAWAPALYAEGWLTGVRGSDSGLVDHILGCFMPNEELSNTLFDAYSAFTNGDQQ